MKQVKHFSGVYTKLGAPTPGFPKTTPQRNYHIAINLRGQQIFLTGGRTFWDFDPDRYPISGWALYKPRGVLFKDVPKYVECVRYQLLKDIGWAGDDSYNEKFSHATSWLADNGYAELANTAVAEMVTVLAAAGYLVDGKVKPEFKAGKIGRPAGSPNKVTGLKEQVAELANRLAALEERIAVIEEGDGE
jgi:hypothetical protein